MVHISLRARVTVADRPVLPGGVELSPDAYTVSETVLAPQGDAIAVHGAFLLANADELGRLVTGGPQLFKVTKDADVGSAARGIR